MTKKILTAIGGIMLSLIILFIVAGRPLSDLVGYFRAGDLKHEY